jgi:hypothetical protein
VLYRGTAVVPAVAVPAGVVPLAVRGVAVVAAGTRVTVGLVLVAPAGAVGAFVVVHAGLLSRSGEPEAGR